MRKKIKILFFIIIIIIILNIYVNYIKYESFDNYNEKLIYHKKSKYQNIDLYNDSENNFSLYLNDEIQAKYNEYYISHYFQCYLTVLKYKPSNILVLGGGDLFCASVLLKFPFVKNVTLVEIDKEMINMVKNNKVMMELTNNVVNNPKLNIIIGDAFKYALNNNNKYDMIIEDIEYDFTKQDFDIEDDYYKYIIQCLRFSDVYIISCHSETNDNNDFPSIKKLMKPFKNKNYTEYTYKLYEDDKIKLLEEIDFDNFTINKLNEYNIINNINFYVLGYNFDDEYGYESYVIFEKNNFV